MNRFKPEQLEHLRTHASLPQRAPSIQRLVSELSLSHEDAELVRMIWKNPLRPQIRAIRSVYEDSHNPWFTSQTFPKTYRWIRACYHAPQPREVRMELIRELLDYYAVETVFARRYDRSLRDYVGTDLPTHDYLNAGDCYVATLYRRCGSNDLRIGCLADLVA